MFIRFEQIVFDVHEHWTLNMLTVFTNYNTISLTAIFHFSRLKSWSPVGFICYVSVAFFFQCKKKDRKKNYSFYWMGACAWFGVCDWVHVLFFLLIKRNKSQIFYINRPQMNLTHGSPIWKSTKINFCSRDCVPVIFGPNRRLVLSVSTMHRTKKHVQMSYFFFGYRPLCFSSNNNL